MNFPWADCAKEDAGGSPGDCRAILWRRPLP